MLGKRREFVYDSSKQLDGVIAHLTRECGGNVHDKGIVNVTASSGYENMSDWDPTNAADLGTNSEFGSHDEKGSWICYNFKERHVTPTSYSVTYDPRSQRTCKICHFLFIFRGESYHYSVCQAGDHSEILRGKHATDRR